MMLTTRKRSRWQHCISALQTTLVLHTWVQCAIQVGPNHYSLGSAGTYTGATGSQQGFGSV